MNLSSIRCPNNREHSNKSGVVYPTCGQLLVAYDYDKGLVYVRCPVCGDFWSINILDGDCAEMSRLSKDEVIKLETVLRKID